jgi:hypothetical protein
MRFIVNRWLAAALLAGAAACGSVNAGSGTDGGQSPRADAGGPVGPDAGRPPLLPPAALTELNAAAGRARGGAYSVDFQVGHAFPQRPGAGGTKSLQPEIAVKP